MSLKGKANRMMQFDFEMVIYRDSSNRRENAPSNFGEESALIMTLTLKDMREADTDVLSFPIRLCPIRTENLCFIMIEIVVVQYVKTVALRSFFSCEYATNNLCSGLCPGSGCAMPFTVGQRLRWMSLISDKLDSHAAQGCG